MNIVLLVVIYYFVTKGCGRCIIQGHIYSQKDHQSFIDSVKQFGYETEYYRVVTEDSYILSLFRIPGSKRPSTLLVHGFLDSSDTWILRGNDSLGISLARLGHDVWFANCRGNYYSRKHMFLDPDKDNLFWNFSFHEMGYYDLPAIVDTILNTTRMKQLNIIGHSQGNTIIYILGSTRPEYKDKIKLAIALSPVCYLHHTVPPVSLFLNFSVSNILKSSKIYELFGYNSVATKLLTAVCLIPVLGYELCANYIILLAAGYDREEYEMDFQKIMVHHFPAGTSAKTLAHFEQVAAKKEFTYFDYGESENSRIYKSPTSPVYNLTKVEIPIVLIAGKNDPLSQMSDVAVLRRKLPNVVQYVMIPREKMNHIDFIWGRNAKKYLHPYIFKALQKYG